MARVLEFYNDVFPAEVLEQIHHFNNTQTWRWDGDKIYSDLNEYPFFTDNCVQWINKITGVNHKLYRCYRTGYTQLTVSKFHYDTHENADRTFLYYGHPFWDNSWGGETTFGEQEETYVKPKPNMAAYFSSEHWGHNIRPVSPIAETMRIVYVWKLQTV